jgi:hypothetical protein
MTREDLIMTKVTIDPTTRAKLHNLAESLEVCDEEGQVLGYYAPLKKQGQDADLYEGVEIPLTDEEVRQLLRQPPGRPLADILADLEKGA